MTGRGVFVINLIIINTKTKNNNLLIYALAIVGALMLLAIGVLAVSNSQSRASGPNISDQTDQQTQQNVAVEPDTNNDGLPDNWNDLTNTQKIALNPFNCSSLNLININTGQCLESTQADVPNATNIPNPDPVIITNDNITEPESTPPNPPNTLVEPLINYANKSPVDVDADETVRSQQLRDYSKHIVDSFKDDRPWLAQTWNYIQHRNEAFKFQILGPDTLPGVEHSERDEADNAKCLPEEDEDISDPYILSHMSELNYPKSRFEYSASDTAQAARNESVMIHELAHVYTLSCQAHPDNLVPIAATYLYFEDLALEQLPEGRSFSHELLADAMVAEMEDTLTWPERTSYHYYGYPFISPESWNSRPPEGAITVVKSMLNGQVPQWFYDEFRLDDGVYDQQKLKRAIWGDDLPNGDRFRYRIDHYLRQAGIATFEKPYW